MYTEEQTITWLAGLLSTDGVVQAGRGRQQKYCFFAVYSVELDWLQVMHDRLKDIGIKSTRIGINFLYGNLHLDPSSFLARM
jgi:hypothetical protein